jgi:hypothetical protein
MTPKIVDIIIHKKSYFEQTFLVLDRMPDLKFYREGDKLLATDGRFYRAYGYDTPSKHWQAFAGAKFDIPLVDGTVAHAYGQWWQVSHPVVEGVVMSRPGISTIEALGRCNVFSGGYQVDQRIINEWLIENTPSSDYDKYRKRAS